MHSFTGINQKKKKEAENKWAKHAVWVGKWEKEQEKNPRKEGTKQ